MESVTNPCSHSIDGHISSNNEIERFSNKDESQSNHSSDRSVSSSNSDVLQHTLKATVKPDESENTVENVEDDSGPAKTLFDDKPKDDESDRDDAKLDKSLKTANAKPNKPNVKKEPVSRAEFPYFVLLNEERKRIEVLANPGDIENADLGVFLRVRDMRLICRYDKYLATNQLAPLFRPILSEECEWFPADGAQEVPMIRWDSTIKSFECAASRAHPVWRKACIKCVQDVFSGETDICRVAVNGAGGDRTHCNQCCPSWQKEFIPVDCVVCRKSEPEYGWPSGSSKTHCSVCKKKNMIRIDFKRCEDKGCMHRATHGISKEKTHCEIHMIPGMSVSWRPCMRCKTTRATQGKNSRITHCDSCFQDVVAGIKSKVQIRRETENGCMPEKLSQSDDDAIESLPAENNEDVNAENSDDTSTETNEDFMPEDTTGKKRDRSSEIRSEESTKGPSNMPTSDIASEYDSDISGLCQLNSEVDDAVERKRTQLKLEEEHSDERATTNPETMDCGAVFPRLLSLEHETSKDIPVSFSVEKSRSGHNSDENGIVDE